jgi:hypothetical protein
VADELRKSPSGPLADLDSDDILNESLVPGATVTDALDALAGGGGGGDWAASLALGAVSGANDPLISPGRFIGWGAAPATVPLGDLRFDGTAVLAASNNFLIAALGAGGLQFAALAGPLSISGISGGMAASAGDLDLSATGIINASPGTNQPLSIASGLLRLATRAAGVAVGALQSILFAKSDSPSNPYWRDSANVERRILTAPVEASVIGSALAAPVVIPLVGAGHLPGLYLVTFDMINRTAPATVNITPSVSYSAPTFGATSLNGGAVVANQSGHAGLALFTPMVVRSNGTDAIMLTLTPSALTGGPPVTDFYASAIPLT